MGSFFNASSTTVCSCSPIQNRTAVHFTLRSVFVARTNEWPSHEPSIRTTYLRTETETWNIYLHKNSKWEIFHRQFCIFVVVVIARRTYGQCSTTFFFLILPISNHFGFISNVQLSIFSLLYIVFIINCSISAPDKAKCKQLVAA